MLFLCASCTSLKAPPQRPLNYIPTDFSNLPHWSEVSILGTHQAFLKSCLALQREKKWQPLCKKAKALPADNPTIRIFFETTFTPWRMVNQHPQQALITSYYEPLLKAHSTSSDKHPYPIYAIPSDMVLVDYPKALHHLKKLIVRRITDQKMMPIPHKILPDKNEFIIYPPKFFYDNRTRFLQARILGQQLLPYYTRKEIHEGKGHMIPLAWVENWVDLAYLQIQGSGRLQLENKTIIRLGYAGQNGHPFTSIAKWLIHNKGLKAIQASKAGLKKWLREHFWVFPKLLEVNPNYVFFKKMDSPLSEGPIGALGVPLTAGYSAAVDERYIALGSPIYLSTQYPLSRKPLYRLLIAQDKGSDIQGPLRIDLFWGSGEEAGYYAEKMNALAPLWLFLPKGITPTIIAH